MIGLNMWSKLPEMNKFNIKRHVYNSILVLNIILEMTASHVTVTDSLSDSVVPPASPITPLIDTATTSISYNTHIYSKSTAVINDTTLSMDLDLSPTSVLQSSLISPSSMIMNSAKNSGSLTLDQTNILETAETMHTTVYQSSTTKSISNLQTINTFTITNDKQSTSGYHMLNASSLSDALTTLAESLQSLSVISSESIALNTNMHSLLQTFSVSQMLSKLQMPSEITNTVSQTDPIFASITSTLDPNSYQFTESIYNTGVSSQYSHPVMASLPTVEVTVEDSMGSSNQLNISPSYTISPSATIEIVASTSTPTIKTSTTIDESLSVSDFETPTSSLSLSSLETSTSFLYLSSLGTSTPSMSPSSLESTPSLSLSSLGTSTPSMSSSSLGTSTSSLSSSSLETLTSSLSLSSLETPTSTLSLSSLGSSTQVGTLQPVTSSGISVSSPTTSDSVDVLTSTNTPSIKTSVIELFTSTESLSNDITKPTISMDIIETSTDGTDSSSVITIATLIVPTQTASLESSSLPVNETSPNIPPKRASGLTTGGKVALGICIPVIIIVALIGFIFYYRRKYHAASWKLSDVVHYRPWSYSNATYYDDENSLIVPSLTR